MIISHHAPAALLRAEKNIIKLGSNVCVYIAIQYPAGISTLIHPGTMVESTLDYVSILQIGSTLIL